VRLFAFVIFVLAGLPVAAVADQPLPVIHDGIVVAGPGRFHHDGELVVQGKVVLKDLTLELHGPIRVAAGATFELDHVELQIFDPPGAPNGTSGLHCDGPAHILVRNSSMTPAGSAHPMWLLRGMVEVDHFQTHNSEFHLNSAKAKLTNLTIFELEISHGSDVSAEHLDLVFLSTHTAEEEHLQFSRIPVEHAFTQKLAMGSGARAALTDTRIQIFLLYVHGKSDVALAHMDRVQLAVFPECEGALRLPRGRLGSEANPTVFPGSGGGSCPFRIALTDVNVDSWDVYSGGHAKLTLEGSEIDEITAGDHADVTVRDSNVYADWLAVSGEAQFRIEKSTVGALRMASERPDLATSQVRVGGKGHAVFSEIRFDCGVVATESARVEINHSAAPPKYVRTSGDAEVRVDGIPEGKHP
jgi:hypothetical protein